MDKAATTTHDTVPTAIRCEECGGLAREEARQRNDDDEVIVRYACEECRRQYTRHYPAEDQSQ